MFTNLKLEYQLFLRLSQSSVPFLILDEKVKGIAPVRARFAYYLYQYLQANARQSSRLPSVFFEQQLPFILEVIITVQYYHNQILDGKGGINTSARVNENLLLANLLKDQLYHYLEDIKVDDPTRKKLIRCVRSIFEYVDIGQYIEKHCGTYQALQTGNWSHPFEKAVVDFVDEACLAEVIHIIECVHPISEKYQAFLRCYLQRIYLTNAALFKLTATFILELLEIDELEARRIVRFATLFGFAQQIVNDNCDFIPAAFGEKTVEKICGDTFCDIRNRTITLPVLIHLQRCPYGEITEFLASERMYINEIVAFKEITENWSIYYSMTCGKKIKKQAIQYLDLSNKDYNQLKKFCGFVDNNRFYKHYYGEKIYYQSYKKAKKTTSINHDTDSNNNSNNGGFL